MSIPKAGALAKASDWSTVFPLDTDAWTAYTPTLTQGVTVTKSITSARYTRTGRWITAQVLLSCTSAGTAANGIQIGLPVQAAFAACFGSAYMFDSSTGLFYAGIAYPSSGLVAGILIGNGAGVNNIAGATGGGFALALATGDLIGLNLNYEALS